MARVFGQGAWYARVCCADEETGTSSLPVLWLLQRGLVATKRSRCDQEFPSPIFFWAKKNWEGGYKPREADAADAFAHRRAPPSARHRVPDAAHRQVRLPRVHVAVGRKQLPTMVAATRGPEDTQSLLQHLPEGKHRGSDPTRGSFTRLAVAGSLVAGLAIAGLAGSGLLQGTAVVQNARGFRPLGAKHVAHVSSTHKSGGKWWEAEVGNDEESSSSKDDSPSSKKSGVKKSSAKKSTTKTDSAEASSPAEPHPTGQITPHEKSVEEMTATASAATEKQPNVASSDKSQDMLTRLFGDQFGVSTEEDERAMDIARTHVDPEELAEERAAAEADKKQTHVDALEEFREEKARDETRGTSGADFKADLLRKFVGDDDSKMSSSTPEPTKESGTKSGTDAKTDDEPSGSKSFSSKSSTTEPRAADADASPPAKRSDVLAADASDSTRERWFEQQRSVKEKEEAVQEKERAIKEKEEETIEKEEQEKAAMIPVERERVATKDGSKEWFVSFQVKHVEKQDIQCEPNHGAAIEEFVGQLAAHGKVVPRVMHVGACANPTSTSRTYDVDFELGDVFEVQKQAASAQAKTLVTLFTTDVVRAMLAKNGLGEAEARDRVANKGFSIDTSKVRFDQRVRFQAPSPDPASLLEPFPLSKGHRGVFAVGGAQSDEQIKNALAQTAVNRGMPSDNIKNLNIASCPFDYRVTFDVTVLGFGCPSGDAAQHGAFGEQYANFAYKYAALHDPPLVVPDSLTVSECVANGAKHVSHDDHRETQTMTVRFDMPRVSRLTDPDKMGAAIAGLWTSENIRDHASAVGVSQHALHKLKLGVDASVATSELVMDPDSKACSFGEVVFNGHVPPGLARQATVARGSASAGVDVGDAGGGDDRMEMMKALSEQVSSGFMSSSSHRVAMQTQAVAAVAQSVVPVAAAATATRPAAPATAATAATTQPAAATAATTTAATRPAPATIATTTRALATAAATTGTTAASATTPTA